MAPTPQLLNQHSRATFVRRGVEENEITKFVIDAVMPYFPKGTQVIGGYVDDAKQFWKVNFHWEYLLSHLDKALAQKLDEPLKKCVTAIRAVLTKNPPNPDKGYMQSRVMGKPVDQSSKSKIEQRWATVRQCKKDFKRVLDKGALLKGMSDKVRKAWLLAVAPVARPGTSKHGKGYALDLYGDNKQTQLISAALGASLVFPEGSHVHVEFGNGVAGKPLPRPRTAEGPEPVGPVVTGHYAEDACVLSPAELAELKAALRSAPATGHFADDVSFLDKIRNLLAEAL